MIVVGVVVVVLVVLVVVVLVVLVVAAPQSVTWVVSTRLLYISLEPWERI